MAIAARNTFQIEKQKSHSIQIWNPLISLKYTFQKKMFRNMDPTLLNHQQEKERDILFQILKLWKHHS